MIYTVKCLVQQNHCFDWMSITHVHISVFDTYCNAIAPRNVKLRHTTVDGIEYIKGCAAGSHAHIQETGLDLTRVNVKYTNSKRIHLLQAVVIWPICCKCIWVVFHVLNKRCPEIKKNILLRCYIENVFHIIYRNRDPKMLIVLSRFYGLTLRVSLAQASIIIKHTWKPNGIYL